MRKRLIGLLSGLILVLGVVFVIKRMRRILFKVCQENDKYRGYFMLFDDWIAIKEQRISLERFFRDNNYETIAIYGMGRMGRRLYDDLRNTNISVKYGIDQYAGWTFKDIEIRSMDEKLEQVDAIVVTAVFAFDSIKNELEKKVDCPIISMEEIIYPLCKRD